MFVQGKTHFPLRVFVGEGVFEQPPGESIAFNDHAVARLQGVQGTCRQVFGCISRTECIGYEVERWHSLLGLGPSLDPVFSRFIDHRIYLLKALITSIVGVWYIVTMNEPFDACRSCTHTIHVVQIL